MNQQTTGVEDIRVERARQIDVHGRTAEYDDHEHSHRSLPLAAACYAAAAASTPIFEWQKYAASHSFRDPWPWEQRFDRRPYDGNVLRDPTDKERRRLLVKAGALIAAEIDRLDRAAAS